MTRVVGPHFFFKEVVGFLGSFVDALQTHVRVFTQSVLVQGQ